MKKFTMIVLTLLCSSPLLAQIQLGGGLSYGLKADRPALTVKLLKPLSEKWNLSPGFTYYTNDPYIHRDEPLRLENVNRLYSIDMDFHHWINLRHSRKLRAYTITGMNFSFVVFKSSQVLGLNREAIITETFNEVGLNLGLGASYQVSPASQLYYEAKVVGFSDAGQLVVNLGFTTTLGAKD